MKRPSPTALVTVGLLAVVLAGAAVSRYRSKPATPEDGVYAMLDATREGDVDAYLNCYSGKLLDGLKQSIAESGAEGFAHYLRTTNSRIQGVALTAPEEVGAGDVKLRVDYVYSERTEAQTVFLRKESRRWKIYRIDGVQPVKTPLPFGSQVTD